MNEAPPPAVQLVLGLILLPLGIVWFKYRRQYGDFLGKLAEGRRGGGPLGKQILIVFNAILGPLLLVAAGAGLLIAGIARSVS